MEKETPKNLEKEISELRADLDKALGKINDLDNGEIKSIELMGKMLRRLIDLSQAVKEISEKTSVGVAIPVIPPDLLS